VIAMRWSAALVCLFPPRLSRNLVLLSDQTGIGAALPTWHRHLGI
jgi:hypothetical protein